MVALVNTSEYPGFGFEHKLLVGNPYFIAVIKQSFELKDNGTLKELKDQIDIRLHDIVRENSRWDSVRYPSELIPHKPKPEIILNGTAQTNIAKKQWLCGIDIKQLKDNDTLRTWSKQILVTGQRNWERRSNSWVLSEIEPTTNIRLSYENAFGGHFLFNNNEDSDNSYDLSYPQNPSGKDWLPNSQAIKILPDVQKKELNAQLESLDMIPAPQLFAIDKELQKPLDNLRKPYDTVPVAGFGSYTNFWQTRTQYLSDELDWSDESTDGGYPVDFDMRHWQQAPADQWLDFNLKGNEVLTLTGFFPEGKQSYTLPTSIAYLLVKQPGKLPMKLDMEIDTLVIDTEYRTLEIVWRRIVLLSNLSSDSLIESNAFITKNFQRT